MYCAIPFFEIQDGGHLFYTLPKFKALLSRFPFGNVVNRTKTVFTDTNGVTYKEFE